jgi:hypothetical protein
VLDVEFTDRMDVFDAPAVIMTLVGLRDVVGPVGDTVADKLMVPLKPFWLVTVIVEVPDDPRKNVREPGFDVMAKLGVVAACTMNCPTMLG